MKTTTILIATILLGARVCTAQHTQPQTGKESSVTDWHAMGLLFVPEFFEQNKDSLIRQIGAHEFGKVMQFGNTLKWPKGIRYTPGLSKDTVAEKQYHQNLNRLKIYKIASWQQYYNNQKTHRYALLRVPYADNIHWDKDSKWDTIYFIIKESAVKEH